MRNGLDYAGTGAVRRWSYRRWRITMIAERSEQEVLFRERWKLLINIQRLTERPMIVLSLVWLALVIADLTVGLYRPLQIVSNVIWALFIMDFGTGFVIAPAKGKYLRRNWLTALALVLPAIRVLRA